MTRREDRLFRRFQSHGNPRDLAKVFDATAPELLKVALHLTRDPHRAEDLLQATYLVAIEDARRFDASRPVLPWLLGILANRVRETRRRARREDPAGLDPTGGSATSGDDDPGDRAAQRELATRAGAALRDLHEPYRQVLMLHLSHGLSAREIAEVLDRPAGTVRTQIMRGLELLRAALPKSMIAGMAVATGGRGLAAVKQSLLEQVGSSTGATAAAGVAAQTLIGGLLLMKNLWIPAVTVALLGGFSWYAFGQPSAATDPVVEAPLPRLADFDQRPEPLERGADRTALRPADAPAATADAADRDSGLTNTGALRLRVRYPDDAPAVGILLRPTDRADAVTDANGEFLFEDLAGGAPFRVSLPQCSKNAWRHVQPGTEIVETVRIPRGIDLRGVVVDHRGRRVAGAVVQTLGMHEFHQPIATTGPDGTFAVRSFRSGQGLIARAPGRLVSGHVHPAGKPGASIGVELRLGGPGTRLAGIVRAADGRPLAGARIAILAVDPFHTPPPLFTTAGRDGRFATDQAARGCTVITVRGLLDGVLHRCLREVELPATGMPDVTLTAQVGGTIFGRIVDDEARAVPRQQIVARYAHPKLHDLPFARASTYSDADGNYRMTELLPGTFEVETGATGNKVKARIEVHHATESRFDPLLASARDLLLRLVDERDQPLVDWQVELLNGAGFPSHGRPTDADGRARFERLSGEPQRFALNAPVGDDPVSGFKDYAHIPNLLTGPLQPRAEPHTIRVPAGSLPSVRITGRLVDAGGAPLSGSVRIFREGDNRCQIDLTVGADGRFASRPLAAHTYRIHLDSKGRPTRSLRDQATTPHSDLALGDVRIPEAARLEVRLRGTDLPAARVALRRGGRAWAMRRDREPGIWHSRVAAPGRYLVQVTGAGIAPRVHPVELRAGANTITCEVTTAPARRLRLELPPERPDPAHWSCTIRVFDAADRLLSVEMLNARLEQPTSHRVETTIGLLPGRYRIEVSGWEKSLGTARLTVGTGAAPGAPLQIRLRPTAPVR